MPLKPAMDKENVAHLHIMYYSVVKKKILTFACKWMELERKHPEWGNLDPEILTWYVFTHKWILAVRLRILSLVHDPREVKYQVEP